MCEKKVLIVGGTGYLGRHLSPILENTGYEVHITGRDEKDLPRYVQIDFNNEITFKNCNQKFEIVFVLASQMSAMGSTNLNHQDMQINTLNYARFLEYINMKNLLQKLVYVSSMTVYSKNCISPVSENSELKPPHIYGLSKLIAENITEFFCRTNKIQGLILRLPGIYGGDRSSGFINSTIKNLLNSGRSTVNTVGLGYWECIHVDDLIGIMGSFLRKYTWPEKFSIFNVSYGEETDIIQTAYFIESELGMKNSIEIKGETGYSTLFLSNAKIRTIVPIDFGYYNTLKKFINSKII